MGVAQREEGVGVDREVPQVGPELAHPAHLVPGEVLPQLQLGGQVLLARPLEGPSPLGLMPLQRPGADVIRVHVADRAVGVGC